MQEIEVTIRLFGAFREYQPELRLELPPGTTIAGLKARIASALRERFPNFRHEALLADSAVGSPRAVLSPEWRLSESGELALLPPVCGG
jgi:molybdopterin converting factor small subunit